VEDNQSSQLGQKVVWVGYYCGDSTAAKIEWVGKEILGPKENCEEEFEMIQFK
jgi:hypothetical protein